MYQEGNIVYFDPFYFKNGNTAKPKYFIILKCIEKYNLVASLPTRKDSIPSTETVNHGCVELPNININCFVISKDVIVTDCGKNFDFQTHLYGHQLDEYEIDLLNEVYPNEGTDYVVWGKMKDELFKEVINCFKNSKSVKRKFKKLF